MGELIINFLRKNIHHVIVSIFTILFFPFIFLNVWLVHDVICGFNQNEYEWFGVLIGFLSVPLWGGLLFLTGNTIGDYIENSEVKNIFFDNLKNGIKINYNKEIIEEENNWPLDKCPACYSYVNYKMEERISESQNGIVRCKWYAQITNCMNPNCIYYSKELTLKIYKKFKKYYIKHRKI